MNAYIQEDLRFHGQQAFCSECCAPLKFIVSEHPRWILCSTCAVLHGWEGFE